MTVKNNQEFQAALADSSVGIINLESDLTINSLANLNLQGKTVKGNIIINSTESGTQSIENGTIDGNLTINTPNATINNKATVTGTTKIVDVSANTFNNMGILKDIIIEDMDASSFYNSSTGEIRGKIRITKKSSKELTLKGTIACEVAVEAEEANVRVDKNAELKHLIVVSPKATLNIEGKVTALRFHEKAADSKLIVGESTVVNAIEADAKPILSGKGVKNLSKDKITGKACNEVKEQVEKELQNNNNQADFEISKGKITKYSGTDTDIVIPEIINGEKVTAIGNGAFKSKKLTAVKIPKTVEIIEMQAFAGNLLTEIELPESLKEMGNIAFMGNKLKAISIPKNLTTIPSGAFSKNEITSVVITEGVKEIASAAFSDNKVESVVLPSTLEYIRTKAFYNNNLKTVNIPKLVSDIGKDAFGKNNIKLVYAKLTEAIENGEKTKTEGKAKEKVDAFNKAITAAKELNNNGNAALKEVDIAVKDINTAIEALNAAETSKAVIKEVKPLKKDSIEVAFATSEESAKARLEKEITIVDVNGREHNAAITWTVLKYNGNIAGEYTAEGVFNLPAAVVQSTPETALKLTAKIKVESKEVSDKKWQVTDFTFKGTAITGFEQSGKEKFKNNKDLVLPEFNSNGEAITEIAEGAFLGDYKTKQDSSIGINSVKLPATIKVIGKDAFRYNALTAIEIPNAVTTIKMSAFNGNKIKALVIPDSVTTLEGGAFTLNEIETLKLPKGMTVVPAAFAFNNLTTVTIPEGVTRIDDLAFSDNRLTDVKLPSTLKYISGLNNNEFTAIEIPKNVTEIGGKAFASNRMKSVTIPGNVKVIGERAFWNTWHDQFLETVVIEEGVEKINSYAFASNRLKDVYLPRSIKEISKDSFSSNLGYEGVVHLFTVNYENPNKLEESKYQIINPAKVTVKYVFENTTLKEEVLWKNPTTGQYFHKGDQAIGITPQYQNNEYELIDGKVRNIDLNNKDNELIIKCNKKQVAEKLTIKTIIEPASVVVDLGTAKSLAMDKLQKKIFIKDSNDKKYEVDVNWTLGEYNENKAGEYTAIGTFNLPAGVVQSSPAMKLEAICNVIVKQSTENIADNKWETKDFTFNGTKVTGLSNEGKEKLKSNKDLVLPKVNDAGVAITNVGGRAFENMGLTSVYIPEGIVEIEPYAFYKNNLKYIDFPGTVKKVESQAFADNKLVYMRIGEGEEKICLDRFSFMNNQLTSVTILKDVINKVHEEAFKDNKGYEDDNNKVHVFLGNFDPQNNGLFELSDYHRIILLSVDSVEKVNSIVEVALKTEKNNITLPEKLKLKLNNGDTKEVKVTWSSEDYDANKAGEYTFKAFYDLPKGMKSEKPEVNIKVKVK